MKPAINADRLRSRLKAKHQLSEKNLLRKHPAAKNFFQIAGLRPGKIRSLSAKLLTSGALASALIIQPAQLLPPPLFAQEIPAKTATLIDTTMAQQKVAQELTSLLPPLGNWKLTPAAEEKISRLLKNAFGVSVSAQFEGNRLNHAYGRMGAEQHLPRYPGDTADQHKELVEKGITPSLGGWGYFAYAKNQMTPELYAIEKYYVAVQTLYLPNWKTDLSYLVQWYKYRRVVVVNPTNGKTLVAAVADAGPSDWTGKHFGGSPEVMAYLKVNYGMQNHPVVLFFLDDPEKKIPLGPVEYNKF